MCYSVSVCLFSSTSGYRKLCRDGERHRTNAAGLWHWAGRDGAAWRGQSHRESPRVSHWQIQEAQSEVINVFTQDAFINITTINISFLQKDLVFNMVIFWTSSVRQDAIRSVSKEGRHLLLSLETSGKEDDSQWDVKLDWETVQRWDIFKHPFFFSLFYFIIYDISCQNVCLEPQILWRALHSGNS